MTRVWKIKWQIGDNIHNNVSEHVIFECTSNFVEVDSDDDSSSEN